MSTPATAPKGRVVGIVVSLEANAGRGFGFIRDPLTDNEYFMHKTNCAPQAVFHELKDGDAVSFHWMPSPKGPKAIDVRRATAAEYETVQDAAMRLEENRGNR